VEEFVALEFLTDVGYLLMSLVSFAGHILPAQLNLILVYYFHLVSYIMLYSVVSLAFGSIVMRKTKKRMEAKAKAEVEVEVEVVIKHKVKATIPKEVLLFVKFLLYYSDFPIQLIPLHGNMYLYLAFFLVVLLKCLFD